VPIVIDVAYSCPSSKEVKTELDPLAKVPVWATFGIFPRRYAALRLLYLSDLLLMEAIFPVLVMALDLLKPGEGRDTEVVMLLSFTTRRPSLMVLASIPSGPRDAAARRSTALNNISRVLLFGVQHRNLFGRVKLL
jgi:hypothetical protein